VILCHGDGASHPPANPHSSSSSQPCPGLLLGGSSRAGRTGRGFPRVSPRMLQRHRGPSASDSAPMALFALLCGAKTFLCQRWQGRQLLPLPMPLPMPFPPPSTPPVPLPSTPSNAVLLGGPQSPRASPCRGRWSPPARTPQRSRSSGKGSPSTSASWWPPSLPCSASPSRCSKVSREGHGGRRGGQTLLPPPASSLLSSSAVLQGGSQP